MLKLFEFGLLITHLHLDLDFSVLENLIAAFYKNCLAQHIEIQFV